MNIRLLVLFGFLTLTTSSVAQGLTCSQVTTGEIWNYRVEYTAYEERGSTITSLEGGVAFGVDRKVQHTDFLFYMIRTGKGFQKYFVNPYIEITTITATMQSCKP